MPIYFNSDPLKYLPSFLFMCTTFIMQLRSKFEINGSSNVFYATCETLATVYFANFILIRVLSGLIYFVSKETLVSCSQTIMFRNHKSLIQSAFVQSLSIIIKYALFLFPLDRISNDKTFDHHYSRSHKRSCKE